MLLANANNTLSLSLRSLLQTGAGQSYRYVSLRTELAQSGKFPGSLEVSKMNQKGQRGSWMLASAHALHLPLIACPGILESPQKVWKVTERTREGFWRCKGKDEGNGQTLAKAR